MSAPTTLAEALAQCEASGVDLTKSGAGMTACMDLLAPFCPFGVEGDTSHKLPRCAQPAPSPAKAAALLKEAEANAAAAKGPPWLLIGLGALALVAVAVVVTR